MTKLTAWQRHVGGKWKSCDLVLKCRMTLKKKAMVVRVGFLEEVRFGLWSWLTPGLVRSVHHPVFAGRPHRSVLSVSGPSHVLRCWTEAPR